jgi:hypothetical protein
MYAKAIVILALSIAASAALLIGCSSRGEVSMPDIIHSYEQAMRDFPGSEAAIEPGLQRFKVAYADLTDPRVGKKVRETYAERLFFNDTLHTFDQLDDLAAYMERTGAGLHESIVEVHHVIRDGADVYVRWTMEFKTRAVGRDIHSRSIGMTHLRFDADGRVVLHQDFWDSGHGLYAHLPFVGFAVRRARRAL